DNIGKLNVRERLFAEDLVRKKNSLPDHLDTAEIYDQSESIKQYYNAHMLISPGDRPSLWLEYPPLQSNILIRLLIKYPLMYLGHDKSKTSGLRVV
ncbi:hypothetical protein K7432_018449, partial [Basidiobolus ranarum]